MSSTSYTAYRCITYKARGCTNFLRTQEPLQNRRSQIGNMKQGPYWGPTNIRDHRTKFSCHGDLAPVISAPLVKSTFIAVICIGLKDCYVQQEIMDCRVVMMQYLLSSVHACFGGTAIRLTTGCPCDSPLSIEVAMWGRAKAQAVSRRPLTAEARARSRVGPCGFCGGQSGAGTGFSPSTSIFPLSISFHRCSITRKKWKKKLIICLFVFVTISLKAALRP